MANTFLSPTMITKEALRVLHNSLHFASTVTRSYDDSFANSGATVSGKIGPSLRIRMPNRYTVSTGPALSVQDTTEDYITLTVSTQKHVDMRFSTADLTLTIDQFSDRYIRPAALLLASTIDYDGLQQFLNIYNLVGVAGTNPGAGAAGTGADAPAVFLNASAYLSNYACPESERTVVLNPFSQASAVTGLAGLFNPQAAISRQYEQGTIGNALGMEFKMDQNVPRLTCGTRVLDTSTTFTSIDTTGTVWTCACTTGKTFAVGDVFSITTGTPVNTVNWETKKDTGTAQQFVVTAATTVSTTATITCSPAIITSGATQTVTNAPDSNAVLTFVGVASTSYAQNLCYHKDAFALATADLVLPKGVDMAAREVYDGVSLRLVRQYDINNDNIVARLDVLYGWVTQYAQLACRIIAK